MFSICLAGQANAKIQMLALLHPFHHWNRGDWSPMRPVGRTNLFKTRDGGLSGPPSHQYRTEL